MITSFANFLPFEPVEADKNALPLESGSGSAARLCRPALRFSQGML